MVGSSCACKEKFRSACAGLPATEDHTGKRYCVLHSPSIEKGSEFDEAVKAKLDTRRLDFGGVFFPRVVRMGQRFETAANFSGATFRADANFSKAIFGAGANFSGATFAREANFEGASFLAGPTNFHKAYFKYRSEKPVIFEAARFDSEQTNFDEATFAGPADFHYAKFRGDRTYFGKALFAQGADFSRVEFLGTVYFGGADFCGETNFYAARFGGKTFFGSALFCGETHFGVSTFDGQTTSFHRTVFLKEVDFGRVQFSGAGVTFHTVNLRPISFVDAAGVRDLDFTNVNWIPYDILNAPPANVEEAAVNDEIRKLATATETRGQLLMRERERRKQTKDRKSQTTDEEKGPRETELERRDAEVDNHDRLAKVYRELAINYEGARHYQQAGRFNFRSLDVDRAKGGWRWLLLTAHRYLSGYWEKPRFALTCLAVIWLSFALVYWCSGQGGLGEGLTYSLGNMALQKPELGPGAAGWVRFLMTLEAILGPLQIGFLALSLRRQFAR